LRSHVSTIDDTPVGSQVELGLAGGVWLAGDRVLVGPELTAATGVGTGNGFLASGSTPLEALLGAHARVGDFLVGGGVGPGLTHALGTPEARVLASLSWSPRGGVSV